MDAIDLIMLGRRLTRIGEETMRGSKEVPLPTGPTLVLQDVLTHPDSSISEVTARTALPQSYVSESVARLRDRWHGYHQGRSFGRSTDAGPNE